MATSNNFQTLNSFFVVLSIHVAFFLLFLHNVDSAEFLSFSFPKFEPNQENLILQGDAIVRSTGKLELTRVDSGNPVSNSLGRALYSAPVRIYDSSTGKWGEHGLVTPPKFIFFHLHFFTPSVSK